MSGPSLKVVPAAGPKPRKRAKGESTQLQLTRKLARAFTRLDRADALRRAALAELEQAFPLWAAGRPIDRDQAREQLISTGYLPKRRIWE